MLTKNQSLRPRRPYRLGRVWLCLVSLGLSSLATAFPLLDDDTLGTQAMRYRRKSTISLRLDTAGVDARTTTHPPGSSYIDRRIEAAFGLGGNIAFGSGALSLRPGFKSLRTIRRAEEDSPPQMPKTTYRLDLRGSLDATLVTQRGIELVLGLTTHMVPSESSAVQGAVVRSDTVHSSGQGLGYRVAFLKRGASWSGGFYYDTGSEGDRTYTSKVSDGTTTKGTSKIQTPPEYGIVGDIAAKWGQFELDLASVQASEGGERTAAGNHVVDDYLRAKLASFFALGSGLGMQLSFHHQTLSYANNAYATIDTIPLTAVKCLLLFGDRYKNKFIGVVYGFGSDGTSITEYNASFSVQAAALSMGFFFPF